MKNTTRASLAIISLWSFFGAISLQAGEFSPTACKVTASHSEKSPAGDFKPENTLDGKIDDKSSWRGEGDNVWIQYDTGEIRILSSIGIAFMGGDKRTYTFDILLSEDGATWIIFATNLTSSGKTKGCETFDLKETSARYVRLVGHGGSSEKFPQWFNLTEIRIEEK